MATYVKFDIEQDNWVTSEAYADDEWSRDSHDGRTTITGATRVEKDGYDTVGFIGDLPPSTRIFLIWAQYGTGNSFGRDGGQYELLEVCVTEEFAYDRKKHYEAVTDYSVPWNGYFEWLEGVHIETFVI
jgi:hypothetical protein